MGYLIVSILVAIATAISVFVASHSLLLAFLAYSSAGTLTLLSVLVAAGWVHGDLPEED